MKMNETDNWVEHGQRAVPVFPAVLQSQGRAIGPPTSLVGPGGNS